MKMKTFATALALSLPLAVSGAYAQTTTAESGENRSASGNATTGASTSSNTAGASSNTSTSIQDHTGGNSANTGDSADARSANPTFEQAVDATQEPGTSGSQQSAQNAPSAPGAAQPNSAATTEAITGWSAKDDIMGKSVFNENDEKIGDIDDVVISSDGETLYLLVGAGGFLGMGTKNVAVPFDRFERRDDRILLSGYSKEQLKALPEVTTER